METLQIKQAGLGDSDAQQLQSELSETLLATYGSSGTNSFEDWHENDVRYIFMVAYNEGEAVGCGAIRPLSATIGELKRMYTKYNRKKIGEKVLMALEKKAFKIGYKKIWLETRADNEGACAFYKKNGYKQIKNFGKYKDREGAICFEKRL